MDPFVVTVGVWGDHGPFTEGAMVIDSRSKSRVVPFGKKNGHGLLRDGIPVAGRHGPVRLSAMWVVAAAGCGDPAGNGYKGSGLLGSHCLMGFSDTPVPI